MVIPPSNSEKSGYLKIVEVDIIVVKYRDDLGKIMNLRAKTKVLARGLNKATIDFERLQEDIASEKIDLDLVFQQMDYDYGDFYRNLLGWVPSSYGVPLTVDFKNRDGKVVHSWEMGTGTSKLVSIVGETSLEERSKRVYEAVKADNIVEILTAIVFYHSGEEVDIVQAYLTSKCGLQEGFFTIDREKKCIHPDGEVILPGITKIHLLVLSSP